MASDANGDISAEQQNLTRLLCRGLSRLAIAAQGVDHRLDTLLSDLRKLLRKDLTDAEELQQLVDAIDARIKDVDDERGRYTETLQGALERLVAQLLAQKPARGIAGDLKGLQKKIRHIDEDDGLAPILLAYTTLQAQVLNTPQENRQPGLFARLFNGAPAAEKMQPAAVNSRTSQAESAPADEIAEDPEELDIPADAEAPFSRISTAVCSVLNQLMCQIEPPPQAADSHASILDRINTGLNWYELVPTLEDLSFVVLATLERDRGEFQHYLLQLNQRLATATQVLQASKVHQHERRKSDATLNETVRNDLSAMQLQVEAATSLAELKSEVSTRLDSVVQAMDSHQLSEQKRQVAMEGYLTVLEQRIHAMEEQSVAMEQQIVEQRQLALADVLTQLPNRSAYQERIAYEYDRWQRYRRPLMLAICDIDIFKTINDRFGHLAGDKVLKVLASTLRNRLRKTDFVARYGGEEFVVLMPETDADEAVGVLEMVRTAVAACPFHFRDQPLKITMSVGLARFEEGDTALTVFERADQALYRAKAAGRDRCVLDTFSSSV